MANLSKVNPGDLIRADLINQLIAEVQDLQTRLAKLENVVRITRILPEGVTLEEGMAITIEGVNFTPNAADNLIMFADTVATKFTDFATDRTLKLLVPRVTSLSSTAPTEISISVRNKGGSADSVKRLVKNRPEVPVGAGKVDYKQVRPLQADGFVRAGNGFELSFQLTVNTSLPGSYQIDASTDRGWQVRVTSQNPLRIAGEPFTDASATVTVTVQVPAGTPDNTTATLSVKATETTTGTLVKISPAPDLIFTTGPASAPPLADNGVSILPGSVLIGSYSNGRITFARTAAQPFTFPITVTVTRANTYIFEYEMADPAGWTKGTGNNLTPPPVTTTTQLRPNQPFTWDPAVAKSTELIFRVRQAQGNTVLAQYRFPVDLT